MLKIGDFSKLTQVSVKALRLYGELGLLRPAWIDRYTGYRYYALEQLPRLNRILALKDLGFSLEQIGDLLRDNLSAAELHGMLRLKHAELQRQVQVEQARLTRVEARLQQIEHEGALPVYEVVLKRVEAQMVAGIRDKVPSYHHLERLFDELCNLLSGWTTMSDAAGSGATATFIAIYHDSEYRESQIDVEAAVVIPRPIPETGRMLIHLLRDVPTMACTVHQGSHETLIEAYQSLTAWTQANGYRINAPNREVYLQGKAPGVDPSCYVTEIQFPVEHISTHVDVQGKEIKMEPKIVTKPAFTVVGMRYFGKNEHQEISAMWDRLNARWNDLPPRADNCAYGVCFTPNDKGEFEYVAGISTAASAQAPDGMVMRQVPESKYAVFTCTLKTIHDVYQHAFQTWLPQSGHQWGGTPDFELYDETFDPQHADECQLYIYIPIK